MSRTVNPFTLSGSSPPIFTDNKIFDKIQIFESALTNFHNDSQSVFSKIALQLNRDAFGALTSNRHAHYESHSETFYESNIKNIREPTTADTQTVSQHTPKTSSEINEARPLLVEVKLLAKQYGLNIGTLYNLIKTEPDFPYINVGLKKKFMIDVAKFETWLSERTDKQKHDHFSIPSTIDIMNAFTGKNKGAKK